MRASVALLAEGRPEAITVAVYSTDETTDGKGAWGSSDHQLYRLLTLSAPLHSVLNYAASSRHDCIEASKQPEWVLQLLLRKWDGPGN